MGAIFKKNPIMHKIVLTLMKCCGLSYIFYDKQLNAMKYSKKYNYWSSIFLFFVFLLMFYNLSYFYFYTLQIPRLTRITLAVIFTAYLYVPGVTLVIIILLFKLKQEDIVKVFNLLINFKIHISSTFTYKNGWLLKFFVRFMLLELIIFNVAFFIPCFIYPALKKNVLNLHHLLYAIFCNYFQIITLLLELFHFVLLFLASKRFSKIDQVLQEAFLYHDIDKMREVLNLYQKLFDITQMINKTFSFPILFMIGNYFFKFYIHIFGIYSQIVYNKVTETGFAGIYVIVITVIKLSFYVFIANKTMKEVRIVI